MSNNTELLRLQQVQKTYQMGPSTLHVLKGVDLQVHRGEFVAIMGASGSGKSTLLHLAGALDTPDTGEVLFNGQSLTRVGRWARHHIRNESFGFVFQFYHLLPELTVLENVMLPAMVGAPWYQAIVRARPKKDEALNLLDRFGLTARLKHRPNQLSGGERQRVAIARALINRPALLLADEPTGNLDAKTGAAIMDAIIAWHKERKQSILLVTHDPTIANLADRTIHLVDGRVRA